jgi:hypothetical protein
MGGGERKPEKKKRDETGNKKSGQKKTHCLINEIFGLRHDTDHS